MQKVVILTIEEYDELLENEKSIHKILDKLEQLKDKPKELNEYIEDLIY
jgi:hypothetical protein